MKRLAPLALLAVLAGAQAQLGPVQRPAIAFQPRHYIATRTSAAPVLDGKLDEADWARAEWTEDFVDIEGPAKPRPRFRTRAKMLWDDDYFYVAVEMEEPDLWATLTERDSVIYQDNDIELFIDPEGSTHRYMELEINQHGTAWDLLLAKPYRDGERVAYNGWDIHGLKIGRALNGTLNQPGDRDQGWTVELAIPWRALREGQGAPKLGEQWRMNFSRVEWQTRSVGGIYQKLTDAASGKPLAEDNWVWSPQGVVNMHYPEMWGVVQFSEPGTSWRQDPAAAARWALREIYYAQRTYLARHQRFASRLEQLGLKLDPVPGYAWPPRMEAGAHQFSARLEGRDGRATVSIEHDGLVH
ncbi:MAG: carbohydrate-binding family 9-like protein [Pseudomonadota bacterium]